MYDFRLSEEYSKAFKLILLKTELKKLIGNDFDDLSCYIELLNEFDKHFESKNIYAFFLFITLSNAFLLNFSKL